MKPRIALALVASALLAAAPAGADDAAAAPMATATVPATITVSVPPCRLSEHTGVADADAITAGRLVCAEIARVGAAPGERYRVSLGTLGSLVILSVAREGEALGSTADSREMTLHGIEDVAVAAPRVATAIVHGDALAETQTIDNVVGQETRETQTKPGKLHIGLGLTGTFSPVDQGFGVGPGGMVDLHYEMGQVEFGGALRFGGGSSGGSSPSISFFAASVGARYFTSDRDVSPYVGGGLAWSYYSLQEPSGFDGNNSGIGAYADAGVEIMRTHAAHLAFGARLDVPFFALNDQNADSPTSGVALPQTTYYLPLTLEARLTF